MWKRPLIRKSRVTSGEITSKFVTLNLVANYADWRVDHSVPDERFEFERPNDGIREESFAEVLTGTKSERPHDTGTPHPLVRQAAPDLKLSVLGGGTIDLADAKGRDIVVLDFWSTTCIPCIRSLPVVESAVNEFKGRNVRLCAVNVGQTAEEANVFLKKVKWTGKTPVLLDSDLRSAKAYSVSTMPHLVVIDSDGVVHSVRTGNTDGLADKLRSELKSLLADNSISHGRWEYESRELVSSTKLLFAVTPHRGSRASQFGQSNS